MVIIKPNKLPIIPNIHTPAVKKIMPVNVNIPLFETAVAVPPSGSKADVSKRITTHINASTDITNDITENTVGAPDGLF